MPLYSKIGKTLVKYDLINNKYKDFLLNIKQHFSQNEQTIHIARNEIKIVPFEKQKLVVKSFKKPSVLKAFYYTKTPSKAKRSYEYALRLKEFTPQPIGFIEFYENDLLGESFYLSEYFPYDFTMKKVLREPNFQNRQEVLEAFAVFSSKLHDQGVLHKDYSAGNILIKKEQKSYTFKIVDLNRMVFKTLTLDERLKNFDMLWASNEYMKIIATQYALINGLDVDKVVKKALYYSFRLKLFKNFKKLLKGKIKNIDW